jgi:hypothetical protein
MRGDVAMHDAPCPDLHQEEHIESSEPSGYHDQEIAGDDGLGVIADNVFQFCEEVLGRSRRSGSGGQ